MKKKPILIIIISLTFIGFTAFNVIALNNVVGQSNGMIRPNGWQNWLVIAVSHRKDNNTLRVILGNKIAVNAARSGNINPWPDGTIIAKVVWKDTSLKEWEDATVPGKFVHVEFMFKNSKKYKETHGWGWGRWVGPSLKPFNKGAQVCIGCHSPVKGNDWVYTKPAKFPKIKN